MTRIKETRKFSKKANIKKEGAKNEKRETRCEFLFKIFTVCKRGFSKDEKVFELFRYTVRGIARIGSTILVGGFFMCPLFGI